MNGPLSFSLSGEVMLSFCESTCSTLLLRSCRMFCTRAVISSLGDWNSSSESSFSSLSYSATAEEYSPRAR